MGLLASSPSQFVAATKAKASEVNAKFTDHYNALAGGTYDHYVNGIINNRISNGSVNITANGAYFNAYFTIDSATTFGLKNSTSRLVTFGALTVHGTLDMTSGSIALIL